MSIVGPVLVLESDAVIARLLDALLRNGGFRGGFAVDGRLAIELLHDEPVAIIVDVNLHPSVLEPGAHRGVGFLRYLARRSPDSLQRTVVLSGLPPKMVANELPPVSRVMGKPFDIRELLRAISDCAAVRAPLAS